MIAFIIALKPIKKKVNQVQLIILETILLGVNACLFALVLINKSDNSSQNLVSVLGYLIISFNYGIDLLAVTFLVIKLVLEALRLHSLAKTQKIPMSAWLQLVVIVLQQGGMGFEEMLGDTTSAPVRPISPQNSTGMKLSDRRNRKNTLFPTQQDTSPNVQVDPETKDSDRLARIRRIQQSMQTKKVQQFVDEVKLDVEETSIIGGLRKENLDLQLRKESSAGDGSPWSAESDGQNQQQFLTRRRVDRTTQRRNLEKSSISLVSR